MAHQRRRLSAAFAAGSLLCALLAPGCDSSTPQGAQAKRTVQAPGEDSGAGIHYVPRSHDVLVAKSGGGPNELGTWSDVQPWPLIPIHAVLMPDGRVLSYGTKADGTQTGFFIYDVWSPSAGFGADAHLTLPNTTGTDLFCSSQVVLPTSTAGVVMTGGDIWNGTQTRNDGNRNSNIFSYNDNTLTRSADMSRVRWYGSSTTLLDGEIYVQGGSGGQDRPEIRSVAGDYRVMDAIDTSALHWYYPRNFVAPDGRLFGYDHNGVAWYIDPTGPGSITTVGNLPDGLAGKDTGSAMFAPGYILNVGGQSSRAVVIDISGGGAPVFALTPVMSGERHLVNATLLADGTVVATGGSQKYNQLVGVDNIAERWDPRTGNWTQGSSGVQARLYHSMAMLLPDATVLVGGGGAPGPQNNTNVEVYTPPYLYDGSGALAPRPTIDSAPSQLTVGRWFFLDASSAAGIARVVLVKTGSVTHSFNMEQRFVELAFHPKGGRYNVQMTSRATDTPPGYYLLFVLDANGVPSIAKTVWINVAPAKDAHAPSIVNPGNQATGSGAVHLPVGATDPDGDALVYSAGNLPPGLSIDRDSGVISGTPGATGTYYPVIAAHDAAFTATTSLVWKTGATTTPLELAPLPAPAPAVAAASAAYTATASNGTTHVRYRWNFGDGTATSAYSPSPDITHVYASGGLFLVTVTATDDRGVETSATINQIVHLPLTATQPTRSTNILTEQPASGGARVWVVNQDNDTVGVLDASSGALLSEIGVGAAPRSIARAGNGLMWVTNKGDASISVIDPSTLSLVKTLDLPRASQPFGIAMSPAGETAYVVLSASGQVAKIRTSDYRRFAPANVGDHPRGIAIVAKAGTAWVSRFITPPQPGEDTANVGTSEGGVPTGGEMVKVRTANMTVAGTVVLAHSQAQDFENQGRGVPNYLGAMAISPDGTQGYVPSKQDNIQRGALRDGNNLNFQNTVRAITSRIDLSTETEDLASRFDHDNASVASAAVFDPLGVFLFVALETSREVAVLDAHRRVELMRLDVGHAPQGLALSPDGRTLFVSNFMDRSVDAFDLRPLLDQGLRRIDALGTHASIAAEKLTPQVLLGKQLFYDARDPRLSQDRYMSCASCHNEGGHDGRVWDLTGFGEGLRNTIALRGRAGGQGFLHWSNNFDEVQDFERQIRDLAGGTGLMADADYLAGTRSQPLGLPKAGISGDLDALAAYVASLDRFDDSPNRVKGGQLTGAARDGRTIFANQGCVQCHGTPAFTSSGRNTLVDIGTLKPSSGQRLGGPLTGIDIPTLRDVWETAPYLHDGSAATLGDAVRAHAGVTINDANLKKLVAYLQSIGREEHAPPMPAGTGTGLLGQYFNNQTLTNPVVTTRNEAVDFGWPDSPAPGVEANGFSVRWSGSLTVPYTGSYRFQTQSNDGIRVTLGGDAIIAHFARHPVNALDTSDVVNLVAGTSYPVKIEYFDDTGGATARFRWQVPGAGGYVAVPVDRLNSN